MPNSWPLAFTFMMLSQLSSSISMKNLGLLIPAFSKATFSEPNAATVASTAEALSARRDVIVVNDVQGALTFSSMARKDSALAKALTTVFIVAENAEALRERLESRGEDTPEVIAERLAVAEAEMVQQGKFDHVVVSGTREADARALQGIYMIAKS